MICLLFTQVSLPMVLQNIKCLAVKYLAKTTPRLSLSGKFEEVVTSSFRFFVQCFPTSRGTFVSGSEISFVFKTDYIERRLKLHNSDTLWPSNTLCPAQCTPLWGSGLKLGMAEKKRHNLNSPGSWLAWFTCFAWFALFTLR